MSKKLSWLLILVAAAITGSIACSKLMPKAPADDSVLDGPIDGLTPEQLAQFLRGDVAFNDEVFTPETGLGPYFVATSCGACHAGDGKGHPFTMLTRFGQTDSTGNQFLQQGGPQLQHRAIYNYKPETIPAGATFSRFMPPANTGLGLLESVSDASLLALADPDDADGDGISGKPNWIHVPAYLRLHPDAQTRGGKYIGRFGKKGAAYDLLHQTVNAYNQDIGITSAYDPHDTYTGYDVDPEISTQKVIDVVAYLKMLKAPVQRTPSDANVAAGRQLFTQVGCGKCHVPEMTTGASPIAALAHKTFAPYTDLLLHDMGPGLDDGYTEGTAATAEWRTPPLWGLGLSKQSQGGQYFLLHDGRAHTIEEAILQHGGEGNKAKTAYQQLNATDKARLIQFLESL